MIIVDVDRDYEKMGWSGRCWVSAPGGVDDYDDDDELIRSSLLFLDDMDVEGLCGRFVWCWVCVDSSKSGGVMGRRQIEDGKGEGDGEREEKAPNKIGIR